jgi:hypothetical protein
VTQAGLTRSIYIPKRFLYHLVCLHFQEGNFTEAFLLYFS